MIQIGARWVVMVVGQLVAGRAHFIFSYFSWKSLAVQVAHWQMMWGAVRDEGGKQLWAGLERQHKEPPAGCGLKEETWAQGLDLMVSNLATTVSLEAWRWVTVMGRKQQLNVGYHVILASTQWPQFPTPTPLHSWMYLWWLHIKLDAGFGIHCSLKF